MDDAFQYAKNHLPLDRLEVLAVDCQASAANPEKGRLLEIGFMAGIADSPVDPATCRSYLIRQPGGLSIPAHVAKITGISEADLDRGITDSEAGHMLFEAARRVAARNSFSRCPTIIHYARFELPFLCRLHRDNEPACPFPLDIVCTHRIAQRLLPDLPRKGIRALAGYFGHSAPILKRSTGHAVATMGIWQDLVALLSEGFDITTYGQLQDWLTVTPQPVRGKRVFPMPAAIRQALPDHPGVYRMRSLGGDLLYIGKAKSLKKRVNGYFRSRTPHPEHILEMLSQARDIDFSVTASALEAAVVEADEIKHNHPPYNKALQPGQRSLVFFSRDLKRYGPDSNPQLCIGPLPSGRMADALAAFDRWWTRRKSIRGHDLLAIGGPLLARPPDRLPDVQCLREGFDLFYKIHQRSMENRTPLRMVTELGAKLWRERLNTSTLESRVHLQVECDDDPEPAKEAAGDEGAWTPETVAATLAGIIVHSAHLIRRGRWFGLLSESSLAWGSGEEPDQLKHLVVFEHGRLSHRSVLQIGQSPPVPPGYLRSWSDRRNSLDLAAYDRMRVVTTELRRLLDKDRNILLRLGPKVSLSWSDLHRALRWV
ncbi:hypothetical protein [Desulfatitalea tepidiphila]|uniref:hypothetical protein n=1 Tax=Desulfatitalea tepidiphila TaxID=1185843 RepID=UPI0006B61F5F|nr:hypothetical protein [Desulfatitalea tepidiphila]